MSGTLQVQLLRVLQNGEYSPVGSSVIKTADLRIIAATNKNLETLISAKKFRDDLYYRLNIIAINIPPLRERKSDIPMLVNHFLNIYSVKYKRKILYVTEEAQEALQKYDYPGNVRELENIIQRGVALSDSNKIGLSDLTVNIVNDSENLTSTNGNFDFKVARHNILEKFEKGFVRECLRKSNGNISDASKIAGIQYANFHKKVKKYKINLQDFK
jgi:transcriptional regulator with PAS, ATPase and Fis domain